MAESAQGGQILLGEQMLFAQGLNSFSQENIIQFHSHTPFPNQ